MEHIASHWLQAAGRHGAGLLSRHAGAMGDEANHTSRVHEAGRLQHRLRRNLCKLLCLKGVRLQGCLERC